MQTQDMQVLTLLAEMKQRPDDLKMVHIADQRSARVPDVPSGTWTKKAFQSHFGYKLHTIVDTDYDLIRRFRTTTASVHDSKIDLSEEG